MPTDAFDTIPDEQLIEMLQVVQLTCNGKKIVTHGRSSAQMCALIKRLRVYAAERNLVFPPPPLKAPAKNGPPIA
jgi:hypothetical protein